MKAPSSIRVPSHLYVFSALGVFGGLMLFFLPLMVISSFVNEQSRFEACQAGTRTDCTPSLFWHLNEWTQQQGEGMLTPEPMPSSATTTQDAVVTTSTSAGVSTPSAATSTKTRK